MARVLVIEDEPDIQALLRWNLQRDGHEVVVSSTGEDGLHELRRQPYDLVLLDLMLPDRDGLDICRTVRSNRQTAGVPVIMLTAKGDENDVVIGLGLGADDYVTKPFRVKELMARIKVRLSRRRLEDATAELRRVEIGSLSVDPRRHEVKIGGEPTTLTLTEFKLLYFLASHPGVVYSRYDLLENIAGGDSVVTDRTVDVHVRNLRMKIKPHDRRIETVRGVGYRFSDAPDA
jgi:DNA-binding response OmpR family regulator